MENVVYAVGRIGKIVIGRALPGEDFIEAIEDAFRASGLVSGNLVSCVGSLKKASFIYVKPKPGGLMGAGYDAPTVIEGPLEVLSMQGPIVLAEGEVVCHFHGMVVDRDGMPRGGHFYKAGMPMPDGQKLPGGNPVLATIDFTILGHDGARLTRKMDSRFGFKAMIPEMEVGAMGKEAVLAEEWGKVVAMDTAAYAGPEDAGAILVIGSHGAETTARHVARYLPFGVIFNDAGKGKNDAGIAALPVLDAMAIIGATVDCGSARISDGGDSYASGIISAVNGKALAAGVTIGMTAREACRLMLAAKKSARQLYETQVVYESEGGRVVLADSISFVNDSHKGSVIVSGSHCSERTLKWAKNLGLKGVFLNDAGKGKENYGISGLQVYNRAGIPAASVDCMSAMIGNARDAWENGLVSAASDLAAKGGVEVGMRVKEAANRLLQKV